MGGRPTRSVEGARLSNSSAGHSRSCDSSTAENSNGGSPNDGSPNDHSNDGDSDESSSLGYPELQTELLRINASIVAHRKTMKQHRQMMMSQVSTLSLAMCRPARAAPSPRASNRHGAAQRRWSRARAIDPLVCHTLAARLPLRVRTKPHAAFASLTQFEGILAHLKSKDHPIHGGATSRKIASSPQNRSPPVAPHPYLVRRPPSNPRAKSEEVAS